MNKSVVWYMILCAAMFFRIETAENRVGVVQQLLQPRVTQRDLIWDRSLPYKAIPTGAGMLGALAITVRNGHGVITRGLDTGTMINTGLVITVGLLSGYAFKRMVYDELTTISQYKKNIEDLAVAVGQLKKDELPELKERNAQLLRSLQEQEVIVGTIQRLVGTIMKTDERILHFQESLIEELKQVQECCHTYEAMKKEVNQQQVSSGNQATSSDLQELEFLQNNNVFDDTTDTAASSNQFEVVLQKKAEKKHSALSNLKKQLFGSSKK